MTNRVFKYPLTPYTTVIEMPMGAKILTVQTQRGAPCIWALVNDDYPSEERRFIVYGTGHPLCENMQEYIGTFQLDNGDLVFHVFEIT